MLGRLKNRPARHRGALLSAALGLTLVLGATVPALAAEDATPSATSGYQDNDNLLPEAKFTLASAIRVDLTRSFATLPLHKGTYEGKPAWYVITDASDAEVADQLGVNFAPKLANLAAVTGGCPGCVQRVASGDMLLGEDDVTFEGVPDFSPDRILEPSASAFPPIAAQPGAVAGLHYSPYVVVKGSDVVYNAPIVAVGDGPFDVTHHSDTHDRLMAIDTDEMTADILFIRGFTAGKEILYLSFEASDPVSAVIERSTFAPGLGLSPFPNGSADPKSARAEIFAFANAQRGPESPPAQGLGHVIADGHNVEDANLENEALLKALERGGDAHNVQEFFPTFEDPALAQAYSPVWDLQIGVWSPDAVAQGLNTAQTDANVIRGLAAQGLVTSPGGLPLAPAGIVINCPVVGFTDDVPLAPQA
jgi:hypothetical protein